MYCVAKMTVSAVGMIGDDINNSGYYNIWGIAVSQMSRTPLRLSLLLSAPIWCAFIGGASAACTADASHNVTCAGANTAPLTIYDQAAAFQPTAGSNSYTPANPAFPAATNAGNPGYNPNPATAFVTIATGATYISPAITTANRAASLSDGGLIAANYSNTENPAVNNVTLTNLGTISLINAQSAARASAIVADSQVNNFTVDNGATGTITAVQTAFPTFATANLTAFMTGAPATTAARYNNVAFAITSAFYSDDNTNAFIVNNAAGGTIQATGNFASTYYGRADTTITNGGTIANTTYTATDTIAAGHWAIAAYAGTQYNTAPNTNPDSNIVIPNADGSVTVNDTSALTLTNNAKATIKGDILALDITPLVYAAAVGASTNPFPNPAQTTLLQLPVSSGNAGPRDSNIQNNGMIQGNFYLGSGTHVIDNASGAVLQGNVDIDQRPFQAVFAEPNAGTVAGTYASKGGTDFVGNTCPTAGQNTTDAGCATTSTHTASVVGGQSLTLTNEGSFTGDIRIFDQATSVNTITLSGTGFTGNVIGVNGTGSNSLTLNSVTNLISIQNFSSVDLMTSRVTVTNGVSLAGGATLATTVYGLGGTVGAPSTNAGNIAGTLTLAGATTLVPTFTTIVQNGGTYTIASAVTGPGQISAAPGTALVTSSTAVNTGALTLTTAVRDARTVAGITPTGGATLNGLLGYAGTNAQLQNLGILVQGFGTDAAVARAGRALAPVVNGADIQAPIAVTMLFHQQVDTRLDAFMYAQIPSSGRSADLGVSRPVPVYGVLPTSGAWIEGIGGGVAQSSLAGVQGYNATITGVFGGYDRLIAPGLRVGGAFGYAETHINDAVNLGTRAGIQTYQGLAYAEYLAPGYYVRGSAGYGGLDYQQTRQIGFDGFSDTAFGSHKGGIFTARAEGGAPIEYHGNLLIPYAAFTYNHLKQDGYTESSGNGAGLTVRSASNDSDRLAVGGKVIVPLGNAPVFSYLFPLGSSVALEARAAYMREFGNVAQTVTASFVGAGNVFVAGGPTPERDMIDYGVGMRFGTGAVQFEASYNGVARTTYLEQIGLLRARYVF